MSTIKNFEDLEIWQESRILCQNIDKHCLKNNKFQKHDQNQIDRSSASVMDNIAEGFERNGNREFVNFLSFSKGSCGELKSQLYRALDKKLISQNEFENLAVKIELVKNKIGAFMKYLNSTEIKGLKFNNKQ